MILFILTWYSVTSHSSIFAMSTVVNSNTRMRAVSQACLGPIAGNFVVVDRTTACTKVGFSQCRYCSTVIELLADHIGIKEVPAVITHSAPCAVLVHLHTSFIVRGTSHQSNCSICLCQSNNSSVSINKLSDPLVYQCTSRYIGLEQDTKHTNYFSDNITLAYSCIPFCLHRTSRPFTLLIPFRIISF